MNNRFEYINNLLSFYDKLLTERQSEILHYHYYEDMSISEIAEILNVSRSAVHDALKKAELLLEEYEDKLHLYQNYVYRLKRYDEIRKENNVKINKIIEEIITKEEDL